MSALAFAFCALVGFFFGLPYQGLTFDLALHLGDRQLAGRGRIAYRRDVVTGISARPLDPGNAPWLRTYRALHSFTVHGTDGLPWSRWLRADPAGLFNSSLEGNVRRAIDVHEGDTLDETALKSLIRAAVALNRASRT